MRYNQSAYLKNTKERVKRLRRIINGRRVFLLAQGASLYGLEDKIELFKNEDICYASVNSAWSLEQNILSKIGKRVTVYLMASVPGLEEEIDNVKSYLERDEDNFYISGYESFRQTQELRKTLPDIMSHDEKILFFGVTRNLNEFPLCPSEQYPLHFPALNSATILLWLLVIGGAKQICLFGFDGGKLGDTLYYKQEDMSYRDYSPESNLTKDVTHANFQIIPTLSQIYDLYKLPSISILNCSPLSKYTSFRKIEYDDLQRFILPPSE